MLNTTCFWRNERSMLCFQVHASESLMISCKWSGPRLLPAYDTVRIILPQVFNQELYHFIKSKYNNIRCECSKTIINQQLYETVFLHASFMQKQSKVSYPFQKISKIFGTCMKKSHSVQRKNDLAMQKA